MLQSLGLWFYGYDYRTQGTRQECIQASGSQGRRHVYVNTHAGILLHNYLLIIIPKVQWYRQCQPIPYIIIIRQTANPPGIYSPRNKGLLLIIIIIIITHNNVTFFCYCKFITNFLHVWLRKYILTFPTDIRQLINFM